VILRYFSSTSTEQMSPDSAGPFTSFDPVGFAIFATHAALPLLLRLQGLSAAKIAAELRVSRNAVIARSQRLRGLSLSPITTL
jgi:hypothetical protein